MRLTADLIKNIRANTETFLINFDGFVNLLLSYIHIPGIYIMYMLCIKTHYVLNTYNYTLYIYTIYNIYQAVYYFCVFNIALLNSSASTEYNIYLLHNTMSVGLKSDLILIRCGWIAGVRVYTLIH